MGRFAVAAAQHFDTVEQIVIADLNADSAQSFAAQMNDKVSAMGLDVSDATALGSAMVGIDLVLNTCGPFYRFGVPILQAAITQDAITWISVMTGSQRLKCLSLTKQLKPQGYPP